MLNTLCIETSGPHCSLALAVDGHIYRRDQLLHRSHNQHLLPLLDALFHEAGIKPVQLELVSFGCGPGSFTGVRIAAAAAQAIATASNAPVVPLSSAWVLAATAFAVNGRLEQVVCCIASRGQAFYLSEYQRVDVPPPGTFGFIQSIADELADQPPEWLLNHEQAAFPGGKAGIVGKVPSWLPEHLHDYVLETHYPRAEVMIAAALAAHHDGQSVPPELGLPVYFDGDSPWRKSHPAGKAAG